MRPGPELDTDIATMILKAVVVFDKGRGVNFMIKGDTRVALPAFSTDPEAAQMVVSVLATQGWTLKKKRSRGSAIVGFVRSDGRVYRHYQAETLSFAICVAAMAAHEGTNIQSS